MSSPIHVELVDRADTAVVEAELATILLDAVDDGASVGFSHRWTRFGRSTGGATH